MSVLPPNFRFLCALPIQDFSDTASCVNGGTPLKPTKTMKIHTNHLLSVKSLTPTIPRQSIFCFELGGSIALRQSVVKCFAYISPFTHLLFNLPITAMLPIIPVSTPKATEACISSGITCPAGRSFRGAPNSPK